MQDNRRRREEPKPCLKWAGGKRRLLPELKKRLPAGLGGMRYYEPFVGAGALLFDIQPRGAVINDNNAELMLTYEVIRERVEELIGALSVHREKNGREYYYQVRGQDRDREAFSALTDVQKAARMIYLNKTCYNGLYRVNSKGFFNVPYGRNSNPGICDGPVLRAISGYLNNAGVKILSGDFAYAIKDAGRGAFIYFDPPYHSPGSTGFTSYQSGGFGNDEQRRLRDVFAERTDAGAKCLLSSSDTPFIRQLYGDRRFEIIGVSAKRTINSLSAGRGEVGEVLIKNWS